jgi:hypothetical protein
MIMRFLGTVTALFISSTVIAGIGTLIALDFIGEDRALGLVAMALGGAESASSPVTVVEELPALAGAKDITFFNEEPVPGLPFSVMTGVRYAGPQALALNAVAGRWCYIIAPGLDGIDRKIELAAQAGGSDPVFELLGTLDDSQLELFRMGATALEALARSHCKFDFSSPAADGGK